MSTNLGVKEFFILLIIATFVVAVGAFQMVMICCWILTIILAIMFHFMIENKPSFNIFPMGYVAKIAGKNGVSEHEAYIRGRQVTVLLFFVITVLQMILYVIGH